MQIDIGARIKMLRHACSLTQEQLATKLGVSAQAVSKWESGTNMPDIQMLPDLSIILGVTIDELFEMTDECRLERIENMIYNVRFLTGDEFQQNEQYLKKLQSKETNAARATLMLAMLYNKRAEEMHQLAQPLAREALQKLPGNKEAFVAVFEAENGPFQDWNMTNHSKTIAFYMAEIAKNPRDIRYYFWLLDLLIADGRTEEARSWVERMKAVEYSYHYEMYMGMICRAECNLPEAMQWWQRMTEHNPEKYQVWFEYGSALAKLGRYSEAVPYFEKAAAMRPAPRYTDCEDAIAQICEILGDTDGAIAALQKQLQVVKEDWVNEGEAVDQIQREIQRLKSMKR